MREAVLLWRRAGRPVDHTNIISRRIAPLCPWWRGTLDVSGGDGKRSQCAGNLQTHRKQVWERADSCTYADAHMQMNYVDVLVSGCFGCIFMSLRLVKSGSRSWVHIHRKFDNLRENIFISVDLFWAMVASGSSPTLLCSRAALYRTCVCPWVPFLLFLITLFHTGKLKVTDICMQRGKLSVRDRRDGRDKHGE